MPRSLTQAIASCRSSRFLAGDAQFIALHRELHPELCALHRPDDPAAELRVDSMADDHPAAAGCRRRPSPASRTAARDRPPPAPGEVGVQQIVHLAQLHIVVGGDGEDAAGAPHPGPGSP